MITELFFMLFFFVTEFTDYSHYLRIGSNKSVTYLVNKGNEWKIDFSPNSELH